MSCLDVNPLASRHRSVWTVKEGIKESILHRCSEMAFHTTERSRWLDCKISIDLIKPLPLPDYWIWIWMNNGKGYMQICLVKLWLNESNTMCVGRQLGTRQSIVYWCICVFAPFCMLLFFVVGGRLCGSFSKIKSDVRSYKWTTCVSLARPLAEKEHFLCQLY